MVDLKNADERVKAKPCAHCGARSSGAPVAALTDDYVGRAVAARAAFTAEGWYFDVTHADTKRFFDTIDRHEAVDDLVFAVALTRPKP